VLLGPSTVPFLFVRARREWRSGRRRPSDAIQWGATRNRVRAGLPILTRTIWAVLDRTVSPLVGRHISPHDLRHSFATRLRSQGADLQYVQQLLGHANIQRTTIYSHLVSVQQRDELARYVKEGGLSEWAPDARAGPGSREGQTTPPGASSSGETRAQCTVRSAEMSRPRVAPASPSPDVGKARGAGGAAG